MNPSADPLLPPQSYSSTHAAIYAPQPAAYEPQPEAYLPKQVAYAPQPDSYQPQSIYAPQPYCWPQQFVPFYLPQPVQVSYHPAPVPSAAYSQTESTTHPVQPTDTESSIPLPSAPPLSELSNDSQENSDNFYPLLLPYTIHNPTQGTEAGQPSFVLQPNLGPPQKYYSQDLDKEKQGPPVKPVTSFTPKENATACNPIQPSGATKPSFVIRSHLGTSLESQSEDSDLEEQNPIVKPVTSFNSRGNAYACNPTPGSGTSKPSFVIRSHLGTSVESQSEDSDLEEQKPTVKPGNYINFNPLDDAKMLKKALKGFRVDKEAIINILARGSVQRLEISYSYKKRYCRDLIDDLESVIPARGDFLDLITALVKPLSELLASEVHRVIITSGSNERILVEILCTESNADLNAIKTAYKKLYYRSLEEDLASDSFGNFKSLLALLVQAHRPENNVVDEEAAVRDAQVLLSTGTLRVDTDESSLISFLCTRSYAHLRHVFKEYQKISGKPLEYAINSAFKGSIKKGLLAIVQSVESRAGFFAEIMYDAIRRNNTKQLTRLVVSRCEIDLETIKEAYLQHYTTRMELDISDYTSGNYKNALLALVGVFY